MIQELQESPAPSVLGPRELSVHYHALADVTRLRILRALWQRKEGTVTDLCQELRISQPLMSWHLRILRRAGLVTTERTGRQVHCAVNEVVLGQDGPLLTRYLSEPGQELPVPEETAVARDGALREGAERAGADGILGVV